LIPYPLAPVSTSGETLRLFTQALCAFDKGNRMTVKELRKTLKKFPKTMEVKLWDGRTPKFYDISYVGFDDGDESFFVVVE
jgi:hypothetical protein